MGRILTDPDTIRDVLRTSRSVAVLGAHSDPDRPAFYVPDYLHRRGYVVIPVNPRLVGTTLWGEPVRAGLDDVPRPVDLLDVFRRAEDLPAHVDDILRLAPKVAWFQQGIRNDGVAQRLADAGIDVVQDRCTYADHRAWRLPSVGG